MKKTSNPFPLKKPPHHTDLDQLGSRGRRESSRRWLNGYDGYFVRCLSLLSGNLLDLHDLPGS